MPIEMRCTGCGQTLRVGDEHAGKQARCPACGTIARVPAPGASDAQGTPAEFPSAPSPFAVASQPAASPNPLADKEAAANPYAPPSAASYVPGPTPTYGPPHRGGAVLGLGIASLSFIVLGFCCGLFGLVALPLGVVAWVMGASDLKKMKVGQMDPSGQGLTMAGMVMGIVSTALCALGMLLFVVAIVFQVANFR